MCPLISNKVQHGFRFPEISSNPSPYGPRTEKWHFGTAPRVSVSNQRVFLGVAASPKAFYHAGIYAKTP